MIDSQKHRGPDDEGTFVSKRINGHRGVGLGHRRLAILDLTDAAAQPMTDRSGRFTIVYNGEVYNYRALREQLQREGSVAFRSSGDTEVVLNAWAHWGVETPQKLQGFFAFSIWDARERKLYLCRDRLGIKNLVE